MAERARVLVVAHRTAATPKLLHEVRARAQRGPCEFTLLVPRPYWDPDTEEASVVIELALPLLEEAAGGHVDAVVGDTDPFVAVRDALEREHSAESPRYGARRRRSQFPRMLTGGSITTSLSRRATTVWNTRHQWMSGWGESW
jgi:hypothetical protein